MWNREGYNHIAASDTESQTISTFETNEAEIESHVYSCRGSQRLHWVYHGLLLTLNFLLLPFTLNFSYTSQSCVYKDSWWSPGLKSVDTEYQNIRFSGLRDFDSEWRGEPSPRLEEAWESVTERITTFPVTKEDVVRSGITLDLNALVRYPEERGGEIIGSVEWTHQLHCLNMLRKYLRYPYYKDAAEPLFLNPISETINHLDHCVDMLRQHIMCNADQGLVLNYWVEGRDHRHVDFNTAHKCRNFDAAYEWAKDRVKLVNWEDLRRHEGAVDLVDFPENLTRPDGSGGERVQGSRWYHP